MKNKLDNLTIPLKNFKKLKELTFNQVAYLQEYKKRAKDSLKTVKYIDKILKKPIVESRILTYYTYKFPIPNFKPSTNTTLIDGDTAILKDGTKYKIQKNGEWRRKEEEILVKK